MLDAVSLDQLRTFSAAVDEGSFSAASRKLLRAQSVVSETISKLEEQIGLQLFDRSGRYPKLTAAGSAGLGGTRAPLAGGAPLSRAAPGESGGVGTRVCGGGCGFFSAVGGSRRGPRVLS